jgi:predicted phage terminase large subunit-like protein
MATTAASPLEEKVRQARRLAPYNLAAHTWLHHRDDRDRRIVLAPHHQVIASVLQNRERFPYVVIVCPPGYAKSTLGSIAYPAWRLGSHPNVRMGLISNTATQAIGFAKAVQGTMESDEFRETYPDAQRDPRRKWTEREMYLTGTPEGSNPALMAMGMDGPILGKRFDEIVIDDPTTWTQARSEAIMEEQRNKLRNTIIQRFPAGSRPPGGDRRTRMVVLMTRYGVRDLLPTFRQLGFAVVVMPAMGYWDRIVKCPECGAEASAQAPDCEHDPPEWEFEWGHAALWPEKEPRATLEAMRENDELIFELVYQANPSVLSGDVFDSDWFTYYEVRDSGGSLPKLPRRFDVIATGVDTAGGRDRKKGDYVGIVTFGVRDEKTYLLDAWRGRIPAPEQEAKVKSKYEELYDRGLAPEIIALEDANEGRALYDYLVRNSRLPVKAVPPRGDKEFRAIPLSNAYRARRVLHPQDERWVRAYEAELEAFPEGAHDDLVDAADLAYSQTGQGGAGPRLRVLG